MKKRLLIIGLVVVVVLSFSGSALAKTRITFGGGSLQKRRKSRGS